jgi:hypothetical protein
MKAPIRTYSVNALWLVVAVIALYGAAEKLLKMYQALWVATDTTIPEASIVYSVLSVFDPEYSLYRDYTKSPFTTTPYTPLYYVVAALGAACLGGTVGDAYLAGRCVSAIAFLGSLGLVFTISKNMGVRPSSAFLATLFACGTSIVFPWAVSCRPDFLALAFGLLGVYFFSRQCLREHGSQGAMILPWVVSFFCKQSFLSLPVSYVVFSALRKRMRDGVRVVVTFTLVVGGLCLLIEMVTGGNFLSNVITANLAPPEFLTAVHVTRQAIFPSFFLVLMCGFAGWLVFVFSKDTARRMNQEVAQFVAVSAIVSTLYFAATTLKPGGAENYFFEPLFLWAILAGALFDFLREELGAFRRVVVLCGAALVWALPIFQVVAVDQEVAHRPSFKSHEKFSDLLRSTPGDILFISNGFGLRAGRGTTLYDGFNASYLEEGKRIDLSSLAERIRRREFSALLVQSAPEYYGYSLTPKSLEASIAGRYQKEFEIGPYKWMVPRASLATSEASR